MKMQHLQMSGIPAIVWGDASDRLYLYVHGKLSCKESAEDFARIADAKGIQTLSFDLPEHGDRKGSKERCDIWNAMHDLSIAADYAFSNRKSVYLFACSIGAYFCLHSYAQKNFSKCLFQSPIVDMEYLIEKMFVWFGVTEENLRIQKEIPTPIDPLRWDYYQYVIEHPVKQWSIPTWILYGGKDDLQSFETIQGFVKKHDCKLTVSQNSEHPFLKPCDNRIVHEWLAKNI